MLTGFDAGARARFRGAATSGAAGRVVFASTIGPQGNFTLSFDELTVDGDGNVLAGGGTIEDTDDHFALQDIGLGVTGPDSADILATFDDQTTAAFVLNLETGDLTPVGRAPERPRPDPWLAIVLRRSS